MVMKIRLIKHELFLEKVEVNNLRNLTADYILSKWIYQDLK